MVRFLAWRNLARQRSRTVLCVLGLAVSSALLYDMALLSTGLRASLDGVLSDIGYELRVLPKGGLPFSSEAALPQGHALARALASGPGVDHALPMWAQTVYLARPGAGAGRALSAFALALDPARQTLYQVTRGRALPPGDAALPEPAALPVVLNARVADSLGVAPGDTLRISVGPMATAGAPGRAASAVVSGMADFRFDLRAQRSVALRLGDLQRLAGREGEDPAAMVLGKLGRGASAGPALARFRALHPEVDAYSTDELLGNVRGQLSYFQQFSLILGTVSLLVTFLLILTLMTLAVNERQGEIAILRALGLAAPRVSWLVLLEGGALAALAVGPGLLLGTVAAGGLDAILRSSPGIPRDLSFFVPTAGAVLRTIGLVLVTGALAGVYPAWLAARTNVVATMHREVT